MAKFFTKKNNRIIVLGIIIISVIAIGVLLYVSKGNPFGIFGSSDDPVDASSSAIDGGGGGGTVPVPGPVAPPPPTGSCYKQDWKSGGKHIKTHTKVPTYQACQTICPNCSPGTCRGFCSNCSSCFFSRNAWLWSYSKSCQNIIWVFNVIWRIICKTIFFYPCFKTRISFRFCLRYHSCNFR